MVEKEMPTVPCDRFLRFLRLLGVSSPSALCTLSLGRCIFTGFFAELILLVIGRCGVSGGVSSVRSMTSPISPVGVELP